MAIDLRTLLTARAQAVVPGAAYNPYRRDLAEREEQAGATPTFFYEMALPPEAPWRALADQAMPAFARFLQAKSINPEDPGGVIAAVFFKDLCYLLRGEDLLALFCELEGLNRDALHFRVLRWLNP